MWRALIWKEWREQLPVVVAGWVATAVLSAIALSAMVLAAGSRMSWADAETLAEAIGLLTVLLIWPLFAAATGATTAAGQRTAASTGLPLSRPLSLAKLWLAKLAVGLVAMALILAASGAVGLGLARIGGRGVLGSIYLLEEPVTSYEIYGMVFTPWRLPLWALLVFVCAAFFGTFVSRRLTVAAAGVVIGLVAGSLAIFFWQWWSFDIVVADDLSVLVPLQFGIAIAAMLLATLWVAYRRGMLRAPGTPRAAGEGAVLAVVLAVVTILAVAWPRVRLPQHAAVLYAGALDGRLVAWSAIAVSPSGLIAVEVTRPDGRSRQIWLLDLDGQIRRFSGRLTQDPVFSPDGEWLAYVSVNAGFLDAEPDASLRVARVDASEDRHLADLRPCGSRRWRLSYPRPAFSPDGRRLTVWGAQGLVVASIDGEEFRVVRPPLGQMYTCVYPPGLSPDGRDVVLNVMRGIRSFEVATGDMRVIDLEGRGEGLERGFSGHWPVVASPDGRFVTLISGRRSETIGATRQGGPSGVYAYRLALLDLGTERIEPITENPCAMAAALSPDGRFFVYAECVSPSDEAWRPQIRLRDLASGDDRLLTTIGGRVRDYLFSPDGRRIAIRPSPTTPSSSVIIDLQGGEMQLPQGQVPAGWASARHLVLAQTYDRPSWDRRYKRPYPAIRTLSVVDVEEQRIETLYRRKENSRPQGATR